MKVLSANNAKLVSTLMLLVLARLVVIYVLSVKMQLSATSVYHRRKLMLLVNANVILLTVIILIPNCKIVCLALHYIKTVSVVIMENVINVKNSFFCKINLA